MAERTGGRKCRTRKVRYRDAIAAKLALAQTWSRAKRNEAHAYRCPLCRGWHLTSQPQRRGGAAE